MYNFISVFKNVKEIIWPMVVISVVVIMSMRIAYLIKTREKISLYKDILVLVFMVYVLALFQIVTFQDNSSFITNNFTPFKEMFRYRIGSRLFIKNVVGNMFMFIPFGFFVSYYTKSRKITVPLIITFVTSLTIEVVQLSIGRAFDVDDILLNIIGGAIGYLVFVIFRYLYYKLPEKYRSIICNIIMVIGVLIFTYFIVVI